MVLALAAVCAPNTPIPVGLLGDAFAAANREPESTARRWLKRLPFFGGKSDEVDRFVPAFSPAPPGVTADQWARARER